MQYPLDIRFKIAAIASQISVRDAGGNELFYVKQKLFKLKENIEVYHDSTKSQLLYNIHADRVIDFSASYNLTAPDGTVVGSVKRHGTKSLWRATYEVVLDGKTIAHVRETNPWVKVADSLFAQLPIAGLFAGFLFHPNYVIEAEGGGELGELRKEASFFEARYRLSGGGLANMDEAAQYHLSILLMTVTLLERIRG